MLTRIVSAAVALAVLVPALAFGGEWAVEIIVPLAMLICLDEYARMAFPDEHRLAFAWLVGGSALGYGAALYTGDRWAAPSAMLVVVATLSFVTFRPGAIDRATDRAARYLLGMAWIAGCFAFMVLLRRLDNGLAWVTLLLALAWVADTGAYFSGRFFGKHKLYERISPKKTWEGYFGGIMLTTVGVFVVRWLALGALSVVDCIVIGVVLGTAGVVGDLAESMIKRSYNVKDSGSVMPGHGGLLDRVDAVLFIAPLLYSYATLVKGY